MPYAGLIFSTVTQFVLQPQKTKQVVKRADLDKLTEVYTGPAGGEDAFIPAIGAHHWQYYLMTLVSADVRQQPGLVVEVTLHYQGKFAGGSTYTSVPTINRYFADGEVSWQQGQYTYSLRYTGRCVQFSFITNLVPNGNPTYLGLAKGYSGIENQWEMMTENNMADPAGLTRTGAPWQRMDCTDVRIEDQGDGWYKIIETYQTRMYPGTVYHQAPPPQVSAGNHLISAPEPKDAGNQQKQAQQAAAYQDPSVTVPITYPGGSWGVSGDPNVPPNWGMTTQDPVLQQIITAQQANADTAINTGLIPDSSSDAQAAGSAAASNPQSTSSDSVDFATLTFGTTMLLTKSRRLEF